MDKLLIVDGMNLLFQMFYGMPSRIVNSRGKQVQGTVGFVGALLKMLRLTGPTHAVVLFDGETWNQRRELDPQYKANRPDYSLMEEDETPFSQLPDIYAALDLLEICHAETENCEADDWIAGYAAGFSGLSEVVIASWDSDFFQLIDPWVCVFRYRGKASTLWTEETVLQRFGIRPGQYADFKALVGDKADNIPGARGVGVKTAAALLNRFGSLQGILDRASEIERACIRRSVQENADALLRNLSLIRLNWTGDLPFSPEDMLWVDKGLRSSEVLREIQLW
jgi:DNA polymerase-1